MALNRLWRGRPRGLRELPVEVVNAIRYSTDPKGLPIGVPGDWWLDEANLSLNGLFLRLTFDGSPGVIDYWRKAPTGWVICGVPSVDELRAMTLADDPADQLLSLPEGLGEKFLAVEIGEAGA